MPESFQPTVFGPRRLAVVAIVVMLLAQTAFGIATAARLTVTHDEYWHIPVGLLNWKTGRFDFEPLNPPLIRLWAAAPLLLTSADSPRTEPTSDLARFGDEFLAANPDTFDRWVVISRCSVVLLTVLSGALLARWAWEWHGPALACLVAWLWSRCPNILAHGSLVTTDLGGTTFWIATLYFVWRFAQSPTPRRAIIAGVVLGLAQAAKYTCVLLAPLVIGLWLLERWRNADVEPLNRRAAIVRWLVLAFVALITLNAVYLFHGTGSSLRSFDFASHSARAWQKRLGPLAALPVPLPKDYVVGVDRQKAVMESKHPVFLDMTWSETGFPHYYLMTLVYKLPHSVQLLFLVAASCQLAAWWRTRRQAGSLPLRFWCRHMWLLVPAGLMILVASTSGMQLGIRYILPALPLLYLFVSEIAATWTWPRHRWAAGSVIVLLAVFDPWHVHPEYLAYFNEAAGGTEGGRFHLLDSNLDWGQDLHELKRFLNEHRIEPIALAYFGTMPPEALGLRYTAPPGRAPQPGWYVVSVNLVRGRPSSVRDGHGGMRTFDIGELAYFGAFDPKQRLGVSLDVYHLTDEDVRRWHELTGK